MLSNVRNACKNVSEVFLYACFSMLIKFDCLMPVYLAAFIVSKKRKFYKKLASVGPGLLQWFVA